MATYLPGLPPLVADRALPGSASPAPALWPSALAAIPLALLLGWSLGPSGAAGPVAFACAMVVVAILLDPGARSPGRTLAWSGISALGTGLLAAASASALSGQGSLASLSLAAGVLVLIATGALRLVEPWLGAAGARLAVGIGLALTSGAPLWLAPAAARLDLADLVVAGSPLTYLSVMADYDYLHAQWFYAHSPLGSVRFAYPGKWTATAIYGATGMLLVLAAARGRLRSRGRRDGDGGA